MKSGRASMIMIVNSILWAVAMVASAILLKDSGYYENVFLLLFTLWMASFLMLQDAHESAAAEWRCIRRFFSSMRKVK